MKTNNKKEKKAIRNCRGEERSIRNCDDYMMIAKHHLDLQRTIFTWINQCKYRTLIVKVQNQSIDKTLKKIMVKQQANIINPDSVKVKLYMTGVVGKDKDS